MSKLRDATADVQFQLTTDGFAPYVGAVDASLIDGADYAMLVKVYAKPSEEDQRRYSPGEVVNAVPIPSTGTPILGASRPATWSGRIFRSAWRCAA